MGRPRILVIDDETELRESLAQALTLDGYDVETARDGSTGATLVCRHPYELIFCDPRYAGDGWAGTLQGDPAALSPGAQTLGVCVGAGALPGIRAVPARDRDAGPAEAVHDSPAPGRRGPDGRAEDSEASRARERLPRGE
jgi:response regulator receiver domain-containing protein